MLITFNKICLVLTYNAKSPTARRRESCFYAAAPARPNKKETKDPDSCCQVYSCPKNAAVHDCVSFSFGVCRYMYSSYGEAGCLAMGVA